MEEYLYKRYFQADSKYLKLKTLYFNLYLKEYFKKRSIK